MLDEYLTISKNEFSNYTLLNSFYIVYIIEGTLDIIDSFNNELNYIENNLILLKKNEDMSINFNNSNCLIINTEKELYLLVKEDIFIYSLITQFFINSSLEVVGINIESDILNYILKNNTSNNIIYNLLSEKFTIKNVLINSNDKYYKDILKIDLNNYLNLYYANASLSDYATKSDVSIFVLSRLIKNNFSKNYRDIIQDIKFLKAIELLEKTDISINDIIKKVGYENNSYFYRRFKELYQKTPTDFRDGLNMIEESLCQELEKE
ncbi:MAG: helix-turn-helix domain-containing protein [Anaeroplasmataceae bacterium]